MFQDRTDIFKEFRDTESGVLLCTVSGFFMYFIISISQEGSDEMGKEWKEEKILVECDDNGHMVRSK